MDRSRSACDDEICDRSNVVTSNECLAIDSDCSSSRSKCSLSYNQASDSNVASGCSIDGEAGSCSSVQRLGHGADSDEISNYLSINNSRSSSCCDIPAETSPMIDVSSRSRCDEDDLEIGTHRKIYRLQQQALRRRDESSDCCDIEIDTGAEEEDEEDDSMLTSINSAATTATVTSNKSQLNVPGITSSSHDANVNIVNNPVSDSNENSINNAPGARTTAGDASGTIQAQQHNKVTTTPSNISNCSGLPSVTVVQLKQKQNLVYFLRLIFNHCKVNIFT